MKYRIHYKVTSRYIAETEASSIDEAKAVAEYMFSEADFGESEEIEGEITHIEDENGNYID